jgi:hypothetical protein
MNISKKNQPLILLISSTIIVFIIVAGVVAFTMNIINSGIDTTDQETEQTITEQDTSEEDLSEDDNEAEDIIEPSENTNESEVEDEPNTSTQPVETTPSPQTYTNQFFPNFSLNYDDSWEFDTTTQPSSVDGLATRNIALSKGDTTLYFNTALSLEVGCGPGSDIPTITPSVNNISGSGFSRYPVGSIQSTDFTYLETSGVIPSCFWASIPIIATNLPTSNYDLNQSSLQYILSQRQINADPNSVYYYLFVSVDGTEYLDEADQIVVNSIIR